MLISHLRYSLIDLQSNNMSDPRERYFVRHIRADETQISLQDISSIVGTALPSMAPETAQEVSGLLYNLQDQEKKDEASSKLVSMGEAVVPALTASFKLTPRPGLGQFVEEVGDQYAQVIEQIGPSATAYLVSSLADESFTVRLRSVNALGRIKPEPTQVVPHLLQILEASEPETPYYTEPADFLTETGRTLVNIGKSDPSNHPRLLELMSHPNQLVRGIAYKVVKAHHPDYQAAVPALFNRFDKEPEKRNRQEIVYALASYGLESAEIFPFLFSLLDDKELASYAAGAMRPANLTSEQVVPEILALAKELPAEDYSYPLSILGHYREQAQEAIPFLIQALQQNQAVTFAARALENIAPKAEPELRNLAQKALMEVQKSATGYDVWSAIETAIITIRIQNPE